MTAVIKTAKKKYYREVITIALVFSFILSTWALNAAQGASLTGERDTLSDSRPDENANHTVRLVPARNFTTGATLVVRFENFIGSALTEPGDFDLSFGSSGTETEVLLSTSPSAGEWDVEADNSQITFVTASSDTLPTTSDIVLIEVGTNATHQTNGTNQFQNPSKVADPGTADILNIDMEYDDDGDGTTEDTGTALVAIIEGVTVSATVAETLSVSLNTVTDADCDGSFNSGDDNSGSSTNTSISFGTLTADQFRHECQDLVVSTNAAGGYSATAAANTALYESSGGNTIDDFSQNGATESSAATWVDQNAFGYSCDDIFGTPCDADFSSGTDRHHRPFADVSLGESQTQFASAAAATTNTARIDYRIKVNADQPAGDYTNVISYVITPTF